MMTRTKIAAKWRILSQTQKAVLYIYLGHCRDIPSSALNFEAKKEKLGDLLSGYHDFVLEVEKCGYASCRKEVREILESIGETGLLYYPKLQKKRPPLIKRLWNRVFKKKPKGQITQEVYEFLLFSSELSESDISPRDTYFTSATLVKFAIFFEMGDDFILSLIDAHSPSKDDLTAFFNLAVCNSSVHLLEELAKCGADTQTGDYYPDFLPVMSAAKAQSRPEVIDFLLSKGASLEAHTDFGENLLHLAADNPSSEILKSLLQKIVPLHPEYLEEKEERDELTPLAIARIFGFRKNKRALIKAGANKKNAKHRKDRFWYERDPDEDRAKEIVSMRWRNDHFEWTPENTQKIISVIQGIDKKVNEMYDKALKVQEFLESRPLPDGVERYYFIKADLTMSRKARFPPPTRK